MPFSRNSLAIPSEGEYDFGMPLPTVLVYIPGLASNDVERARAVAGILGLAIIDAKMLLAARTPRRVGAFVREEDAHQLAVDLQEVGIRAFVLDKEDFTGPANITRAKGLVAYPDRLTFTDTLVVGSDLQAGPREMTLRKGEVKAIVSGVVTEEIAKASIDRKWIETHVERRGDLFLHLYWGSALGFLEIRHTTFDYSCLENRTHSSVDNFQTITAFLRQFFAHAAFDEVLSRQPGDANIMTASLPVDWTVGPAQVGAVSATRTATDEAMMMCASRIVARALMS